MTEACSEKCHYAFLGFNTQLCLRKGFYMKIAKMFLAFFLISLPLSSFALTDSAKESDKASEMSKPPKEPPSEEAQEKAHQRVEVRKKQLEKKVKSGASAEEIGKAKARVQVDRTESNRQDYLKKAKEELKTQE